MIHQDIDNCDTVPTIPTIPTIENPPCEGDVVKPLKAIGSMDECLRSFGKTLGRKAITELSPLHVPGRDPLPEFDDMLREPFEPQKHVVAAAIQMMDAVGSGFIVGEMGCIAGESEVYDPVAGRYRRVDQITESFHVVSYHDGKAVVGKAHVPFIKGTRELYRVTLSNGRTFVATDHHRILTDRGYELVSVVAERLRESGSVPLPSIAEPCPSALGEFTSESVHVTEAVYARTDCYYDFTVDEFHNYVMAGVVHHNTGKTLLGMTSVFKHAQRSRNQGGFGGKFRCVVLCPDHLITKWAREIEETIPGAIAHRFDKWTEVVKLLDRKNGRRWAKPKGPEFYVLGRNQAKWYPEWLGISDPRKGFSGTTYKIAVSSKNVVVDRVPKLDENDRAVLDHRGDPVMENISARVHYCPRCGTPALDKKGVPLGAKHLSDTQQTCQGRYLEQILDNDRPQNGLDILSPIPSPHRDRATGQEVNHAGKKWIVRDCQEPLWNWTSRPCRWAPARIIQKKLRRFFHYLIIDEVHEQKSDESAQSMACGKLIASVRHTIALTGTIIGGYANHLFPLMIRLNPKTLRDEGFEWGKDLAFTETYGRIDRIITTREDDSCSPTVRKNVKSMRRSRSGKSSERKAVRPGVMPTLFGRHMIGSSMFITLGELASELPDLFEYIGGPFVASGDNNRDARAIEGWIDVACDMLSAQKAEYDRVTGTLESANKELLRKGSMKLLGAYLWTVMDYPDRPWGWDHDKELLKVLEHAKIEVIAEKSMSEATQFKLGHTVGYWDRPGVRTLDNFVGIVTPQSLDASVIYPKEQRLIEICKRQKADGIQTWVYVQMTGKRNVQPRLKTLLETEGLKVGVLRSGDVDPKEREDWIAKHGREFDVMISHPQLASTGLDLFSKAPGGHNYATLVFYETGYNLFTMRQAARRAWRIGQPRDCRVYYLYYKGTMQQRAMQLMSRKMAAAQALEGEFSEDGLAAMAGEDNLQMALAKSLADRIDASDMQRSWAKVASGPKSARKLIESATDLVIKRSKTATKSTSLKLHHPGHELAVDTDSDGAIEMPEFDAELVALMLANLSANGMILADLAG